MSEIKINIGGVSLNVPSEAISQGIEKGELTIESNDLIIKPKTEYETFLTNTKKEEYERGKVAGIEMPIKEAREKYGLSFEGKTIENFAEALKTKVLNEAKVEPSKQISELVADKEKLQTIAKDWEAKHNNLLGTFENEKKQGRIEKELLSKLPKDGISIPNEDLLLILKSRNDFDIEGSNIVIKRGGEVVKNPSTLNPVTLDEMLPELIKPYIVQRKGGNGGENDNEGKAGTLDAFIIEMRKNGIAESSSQFNTEMAKRMKEGTLKL